MLDAFANRIGDNTWQTVITQEGLNAVKKLLRKIASKNTPRIGKTMPKNNKPENGVDWDLTSWEGSCREQLRRWAQLPLERIIAALEEMQEMSKTLAMSGVTTGATVQEQPGDYTPKLGVEGKPDNEGSTDE